MWQKEDEAEMKGGKVKLKSVSDLINQSDEVLVTVTRQSLRHTTI